MKKLLYITEDYQKYKNKINAESKSFHRLEIDPYIISTNRKDNDIYLEIYHYDGKNFNLELSDVILTTNKKIANNYSIGNLLKRIKLTMKLDKVYKRRVLDYFDKNGFDYCYIRRIGFFVIFFRKMIKKLSKKSKVIYEIPTYPIDTYGNFLVDFSQVLERIYFKLFIKKHLTVIPVVLQNDCKMDKKMFEIRNGIDYDLFTNLSTEHKSIKNKLRIVTVAHVQNWHGYERFINSLSKYKGNYDVSLTIYGEENAEVEKLKKLAKDLNLEKKILFPGKININEMIKNSENYDVGLGGLRYHIKGAKYDTSIKNKEFCAMGLPFIAASIDLSFNEDFKYLYKVSDDDQNFSIEDIVSWYESLDKKVIKKEMKKYAEEELSFYKLYKEMFKKIG